MFLLFKSFYFNAQGILRFKIFLCVSVLLVSEFEMKRWLYKFYCWNNSDVKGNFILFSFYLLRWFSRFKSTLPTTSLFSYYEPETKSFAFVNLQSKRPKLGMIWTKSVNGSIWKEKTKFEVEKFDLHVPQNKEKSCNKSG